MQPYLLKISRVLILAGIIFSYQNCSDINIGRNTSSITPITPSILPDPDPAPANAGGIDPLDAWDRNCASPSEGGFSKTIFKTWDWSTSTGHLLLDTVDPDVTGYRTEGFHTVTSTKNTTDGIVVVTFIATGPADPVSANNLALASAIPFPAPHVTAGFSLAISTEPCRLNVGDPGLATDSAPTVVYGVGEVPTYWATNAPTAVALIPGKRYFINVAMRSGINSASPFGTPVCVDGVTGYPNCDFRVEANKPAGH